ncbi:unnamed protein product [Ambrosiozyma monospora]|uniref:Unnamed protein product n=1 Tax=Ambrosiozyma monospora TaxID=43982 RepID=A0A9W6YYC4_AMBMO|nr:unnamed protein product [Ambrosiozyma monospora]
MSSNQPTNNSPKNRDSRVISQSRPPLRIASEAGSSTSGSSWQTPAHASAASAPATPEGLQGFPPSSNRVNGLGLGLAHQIIADNLSSNNRGSGLYPSLNDVNSPDNANGTNISAQDQIYNHKSGQQLEQHKLADLNQQGSKSESTPNNFNGNNSPVNYQMANTSAGGNSSSMNPSLYGGLASTLLQQNTAPQPQLQSEPHTPIIQLQQQQQQQQQQNTNDANQITKQLSLQTQREYTQAGVQNGYFIQTSQSAAPTIPNNMYTSYPPRQNTVDMQSQKEIKDHVQTDIKYFTNLLESSSLQQNLNLNPQDTPSGHKLKHYATKAKFFYKWAHENLPFTGRIGHSLQFVLDNELPDLKADLTIWWSNSPSTQPQTVPDLSSNGQKKILPVPVPPIGKFDPVEWTPYYYHMLAEEVANVLLYNLNFTVAMKDLLSDSSSMGNVDEILGSPYKILTTMLPKELQDDDVPGLSQMMH